MPKNSRPKTTPFRRPPDFSRFFPRSRARGTGTERIFLFTEWGSFLRHTIPSLASSACFGFPLLFPSVHSPCLHAHQSHGCTRKRQMTFPQKKTKFHATLPRFSEQEEHHLLLRLGLGGLVLVLLVLLGLPSAVRHSHLFP